MQKLFLIFFFMIFLSCENLPLNKSKDDVKKKAEILTKKAEKITSDVYQSSEEISALVSSKIEETLSRSNETLPAKELNKLREFEYKIEEFNTDIKISDLEKKLNLLGKEHWDCRPLELNTDEKLKFLCKKRPFTPLRFIPKIF